MDDAAAALGLAHLLAAHGWPLKLPTGVMSPSQIWRLPWRELAHLLGVSSTASSGLEEVRSRFSPGKAFAELERLEIKMIVLGSTEYPHCLAQIHDPPPAIFLKGRVELLGQFMRQPRISIVGSRKASRYGIGAAEKIATGLSRAGICVISGMAMGIDAAAHRGALSHKGSGGTIAVLGCGADVIYPKVNTRLYRQILDEGLILSEYPPGTVPHSWRFPARNRIIAGLADGVAVVEAREKSGALITVDYGLEMGKEIWAVPGSIFSNLSEGPLSLLRLGATPARSCFDIMEDIGIDATASILASQKLKAESCASSLKGDERLIYDVLDDMPAAIDILAQKAGLDAARSSSALVLLELRQLVQRSEGNCYSLSFG